MAEEFSPEPPTPNTEKLSSVDLKKTEIHHPTDDPEAVAQHDAQAEFNKKTGLKKIREFIASLIRKAKTASSQETQLSPNTTEPVVTSVSQEQPKLSYADTLGILSPREAIWNLIDAMIPTKIQVAMGDVYQRRIDANSNIKTTTLYDHAGREVPEEPGQDRTAELVANETKRVNESKDSIFGAFGKLIKSFGPAGLSRMFNNKDIDGAVDVNRRQHPVTGVSDLIDENGQVVHEHPGENKIGNEIRKQLLRQSPNIQAPQNGQNAKAA